MTTQLVRKPSAHRQRSNLPVQLRQVVAAIFIMLPCSSAMAAAAGSDVSSTVSGPQRLLVVAVRFPGTVPTLSLEQIQEKIKRVGGYLRESSYGKAWIAPKLAGWYDMPDGIDVYKISPYNRDVDPMRVRRLVADALGAAQRDADLGNYDIVWIVVGAFTRPGQGYGMICYTANPGMLSTTLNRGGFRPRLETVALTGGGSFAKPVTVSAENAHLGHAVRSWAIAICWLKIANVSATMRFNALAEF